MNQNYKLVCRGSELSIVCEDERTTSTDNEKELCDLINREIALSVGFNIENYPPRTILAIRKAHDALDWRTMIEKWNNIGIMHLSVQTN